MGASASRHATGKASSSRSDGSHSERLAKSTSGAAAPHERGTRDNSGNPNFLAQHRNSSSADESAAARVTQQQQQIFHQHQQQRSRQQSIWSLGSLSGPSDWSFTGVAARNSFRNRNKTNSGKSSNALQQRRSKTVWHRPLTDVIFSSHFKPNSRNEHFHVERLIAKGAFGVVFKVIDKRALQAQQLQQAAAHTERITNGGSRYPANATVFALKVLKKSKIIEQNSVQQIKDEADIQKLCGHHPFIVQQIDLWQNRRNLHILSEYVPNGELFSTIATFSLELIRLYIAEIALAIDFLHNAGIIYRDAKPENILLTETYHIKLTDFGLSKWLSLGSTTSTMCGTLQYMAPEIVRGERYGHAADWWSLGVIACQMFALECPDVQRFLDAPLAPKTDAAAVDVTDELPPPPSPPSTDTPPAPLRGATGALAAGSFLPAAVDSLPHAAKDVIQRLLQLEPQKRLRSVLALQRIAFYHNYSVDAHHLLSISPLDIIRSDHLVISKRRLDPEDASDVATKAFECF